MNGQTMRKNNLSFGATWMDPEALLLREISQKKQILSAITYMWNFKTSDAQKQGRRVVTKGWGMEELGDVV